MAGWSTSSVLHAGIIATILTACNAGTASLPSYPLAVKSPYLSTWLPGNQISNAASAEPQFWAGQTLTWPILARVNGKLYSLFGNPSGASAIASTTKSYSYTSSHTFIQLTAGPASITLDFFSPVLPGISDYARQSLPYSFLTVTATSSQSVDVQVLSGIDQTWTAQNGAAHLNYTISESANFFQFYNPDEIEYTEAGDMATYGSVVFGASPGHSLSASCNTASSIYSEFKSKGSISGTSDCGSSSLAALARNLGTIKDGSAASSTFAVGFDRVHAVNYVGNAQTGLYRATWPTIQSQLSYFLQDYNSMYSTSISFDNAVREKSVTVSNNFGAQYGDIVEASVRQTFGAIELTVPLNDLSATPQIFLKEISSDGNVNTVDVIFQSWPIFMSLNPTYIRYLFQPIISFLASGAWPEPYVIHDIGFAYPNATGHTTANGVEEMPLFETSSLLILLYAYQKLTGDTSWAQQYSSLLNGYAEYLVQNSLYPASQLISVDAIAARPNQTGLAIQSAIGLNAAAKLLGNSRYSTTADSYANTIYREGLGLSGPTPAQSTHFTYYYGQDSTWNVLFPAFSDVALQLNTFPSSAWELQSKWYANHIQTYGLPFAGPMNDTNYDGSALTWGLTDWNIVAASISSPAVQQAIVETTYKFLTDGLNDIPFGTKFNVETGQWEANKARPTVGSDFAFVALKYGVWGTSY